MSLHLIAETPKRLDIAQRRGAAKQNVAQAKAYGSIWACQEAAKTLDRVMHDTEYSMGVEVHTNTVAWRLVREWHPEAARVVVDCAHWVLAYRLNNREHQQCSVEGRIVRDVLRQSGYVEVDAKESMQEDDVVVYVTQQLNNEMHVGIALDACRVESKLGYGGSVRRHLVEDVLPQHGNAYIVFRRPA
jgi:hypothetical protein